MGILNQPKLLCARRVRVISFTFLSFGDTIIFSVPTRFVVKPSVKADAIHHRNAKVGDVRVMDKFVCARCKSVEFAVARISTTQRTLNGKEITVDTEANQCLKCKWYCFTDEQSWVLFEKVKGVYDSDGHSQQCAGGENHCQ